MRSISVAALCGLVLLSLTSMALPDTFLDRKFRDWLNDLKRKEPTTRRSAAFALGRMGGEASSALADLARLAESDPDASVRAMAAAAIGEIAFDMGPQIAALSYGEVSASLEKALSDDDARVRRGAAYALGAYGQSAAPAAAAIRKALRDTMPAVRQNAAWALGRMGKTEEATVAALCNRLKDSTPLVRRDAAAALGKLGQTDRKAVHTAGKPLLDLVKSEKDEVVRKTALVALASLAGPEHRAQAGELYPLLKSDDEETARAAAFVLGNMGGEPAKLALPTLKRALASIDPSVQQLAAATLANAGPDAADAIDDLAKTLSTSRDNIVRRNCCVAVSLIGRAGVRTGDAARAVPALVAAMKPTDDKSRPAEQVRELAAEALAQIRFPGNESAMPAVRQTILKDKNNTVRHRCIWAVFNVTDLEKFDLVKPISDLLNESTRETLLLRYDGARVLAFALRDKAPDKTVDVLLDMLGNKDLQEFRKTDARIKEGKNEGGGDSSVKSDVSGDARYMAAEALSWMRAKVKDNDKVIAALKVAAADKDEKLKKAAATALAVLDKK